MALYGTVPPNSHWIYTHIYIYIYLFIYFHGKSEIKKLKTRILYVVSPNHGLPMGHNRVITHNIIVHRGLFMSLLSARKSISEYDAPRSSGPYCQFPPLSLKRSETASFYFGVPIKVLPDKPFILGEAMIDDQKMIKKCMFWWLDHVQSWHMYAYVHHDPSLLIESLPSSILTSPHHGEVLTNAETLQGGWASACWSPLNI